MGLRRKLTVKGERSEFTRPAGAPFTVSLGSEIIVGTVLTFIKLVRTAWLSDSGEDVAQVGR
jgi:hypothetical protein